MPIFAAVFVRTERDWSGTDVDLSDVDSIDDVTDVVRDVAGKWDGGDGDALAILLLEEDDEWFGLVRLEDHGDPQVFLSDTRVVRSSPVAALFTETGEVELPDEPEGTGQPPWIKPGGTTDLLTDLGTSGSDLLALTIREGVLPADVLLTIAERAGFAEPLDLLRS